MKLPVKKIWIATGVILLLLILLNPGIGRFKEYSGLTGKDSHYIKRTYNFLIFSIYEDAYNDNKYIGVLLNFINITHKKSSPEPSDTIMAKPFDTTFVVSPSIDKVQIGSVYKTKDGRTYTKNQLLNSGYSVNRIRDGVYNGVLIPVTNSDILRDGKMRLWDKLNEINLFVGSFEEFKQKYSSTDSIDFLFNGLSDDGLYWKNNVSFYQEYFPELIGHTAPKGFTPYPTKDSIR